MAEVAHLRGKCLCSLVWLAVGPRHQKVPSPHRRKHCFTRQRIAILPRRRRTFLEQISPRRQPRCLQAAGRIAGAQEKDPKPLAICLRGAQANPLSVSRCGLLIVSQGERERCNHRTAECGGGFVPVNGHLPWLPDDPGLLGWQRGLRGSLPRQGGWPVDRRYTD